MLPGGSVCSAHFLFLPFPICLSVLFCSSHWQYLSHPFSSPRGTDVQRPFQTLTKTPQKRKLAFYSKYFLIERRPPKAPCLATLPVDFLFIVPCKKWLPERTTQATQVDPHPPPHPTHPNGKGRAVTLLLTSDTVQTLPVVQMKSGCKWEAWGWVKSSHTLTFVWALIQHAWMSYSLNSFTLTVVRVIHSLDWPVPT